ncbi:hypothetical protein TeGR_g9658, partial [Tetraparma gracilis]
MSAPPPHRSAPKSIDASASAARRQSTTVQIRKARRADFLARRRQGGGEGDVQGEEAMGDGGGAGEGGGGAGSAAACNTASPAAAPAVAGGSAPLPRYHTNTKVASLHTSPDQLSIIMKSVTKAPVVTTLKALQHVMTLGSITGPNVDAALLLNPGLVPAMAKTFAKPTAPLHNRTSIAHVLTNLASVCSLPTCEAIATNFLHLLNAVLSGSLAGMPEPDTPQLELLTQCLWILGNLG